MGERPRTVWIGTDTPFVLEEFRDKRTGQLITGITDGTLKIYDGTDNELLGTISLDEQADKLGSYEVLVPDTFTEDASGNPLVEGQPLRLQFEISGGIDLMYRMDARAIARVKKDDGL